MTTALTNCLYLEAESIRASAKKLSKKEVEHTLSILKECKNNKSKIVITGVGKSGIVARKIAATFSSIGLMSIYLNPLDAVHGDLGIIAKKDVVILLSNSGETQEIIDIISHLKDRETTLIGLLGKVDSTIGKKCAAVLDASVDKEVCPLNLAPTASTSVAMAIGDALAVVWMDRQGISSKDFAVNHPAGNLGKKLTLKAKDIMIEHHDLSILGPSSFLPEIIIKLTQSYVGACLITVSEKNDKLLGIITDGDLRRVLQNTKPEFWNNIKAEEFMTQDPIVVFDDVLAISALEIMECNRKKAISVLPILNRNKNLIGLLSLHDLIKSGLN